MVLSLRQLQEKCKEQRKPLYIAIALVSRANIDCLPTLLGIIRPSRGIRHSPRRETGLHPRSHTPEHYAVLPRTHEGDHCILNTQTFDIRHGVKQGCILAPTLFGMVFAVMPKYALGTATEGIYLRTRSDGKLFYISRLKAKTRIPEVCLRDFLFADDAAVTTYTEEELQQLMQRLTVACEYFGLPISLKTIPR